MKPAILFMIWCLTFSINAIAQDPPFKFGKMKPEDMQIKTCPIDSNAEAYFIGDYGQVMMDLNSGNLVYERHFRIKIINKNGYNWATIKIPLFGDDYYSSLKANTYNLVAGKVEKTELETKNKLEEHINNYLKSVNFAMPNVKEGSIIEVKYKIYSQKFSIPHWDFQYSIPNIESRYIVAIPEFFNYKRMPKGYYSVKSTIDYSNARIGQTSFDNKVETYLANNVPALKEEAYVDCIDNYRSSIDYELASYRFPGDYLHAFNTTFETICKSLVDDEQFYGQLKTSMFLNDEIDSIKKNYEKPADRMAAVYNFVQRNMKWNNRKSFFVNESIRKAFKQHSGSAGEINLLLVYLLKKVDLNADPVILSTRDNGKLRPEQPMISAYNYVIAQVRLDEAVYSLDATEKKCPLGMLPPRCLNGEGLVVNEKVHLFQPLTGKFNYKKSRSFLLNLSADGTITGDYKTISKDYAALDFRNNFSSFNSKDEYIKNFENNISGIKVNDLAIEDFDSISKPIKSTMKIELTGHADVQNNDIYVYPLLFTRIDKNPFKLDDRKFPIDYNYPYDESYTLVLNLPEGYVLSEEIKNYTQALPMSGAKYSFSIINNGTSVIVNRKLLVNKDLFGIEDYPKIKEFYNQIVKKESEMLVFKKKV